MLIKNLYNLFCGSEPQKGRLDSSIPPSEIVEKENTADIIYPIHVQSWQKGLHKHFADKNFENVIIDPSTQRLSYFAFGNTKGLVELPYAPEKGVISLEYLLQITFSFFTNVPFSIIFLSEGHSKLSRGLNPFI